MTSICTDNTACSLHRRLAALMHTAMYCCSPCTTTAHCYRVQLQQQVVQHEDEEDGKLYCICRQPYDAASGTMVECGYCQDWLHVTCVGLSPADCESITTYACPRCCKRGRVSIRAGAAGASSSGSSSGRQQPAAGRSTGSSSTKARSGSSSSAKAQTAAAATAAVVTAGGAVPLADSATLKRAQRAWLLVSMPPAATDLSYVPQVGDLLCYFPIGHAALLAQHPDARAAAVRERTPLWHDSGRSLESLPASILCTVQSVSYELPARGDAAPGQAPIVSAVLRLVPAPAAQAAAQAAAAAHGGGGAYRSTLRPLVVSYRPSDCADFVVLRSRIARAEAEQWQQGDPFSMNFADGGKYYGTVLGVSCGPRGSVVWEGASVRWNDGGEVSCVNVWELDRTDGGQAVRRQRAYNGLADLDDVARQVTLLYYTVLCYASLLSYCTCQHVGTVHSDVSGTVRTW
jgi:hypothetical protein